MRICDLCGFEFEKDGVSYNDSPTTTSQVTSAPCKITVDFNDGEKKDKYTCCYKCADRINENIKDEARELKRLLSNILKGGD